MTFLPPEGYVDPSDPDQVAAVLGAVLRVLGMQGFGDLLGRIPGSRVEPTRPGGVFKRAVPASVWLTEQHQLLLSDPLVHVHVVGGIVLARDPLPAGVLPDTVARLLVAAVSEQGSHAEAALVLTAARESTERVQP
jgi:hypothetical protein